MNSSQKAIIDTFVAPPCDAELKILYQDDNLLWVEKPSGLLSLSGKNPLNKDSVHFRLVRTFPTALMLHRLDFGTSGIMLVALNKKTATNINQQFQNRSISKTYHAILKGQVESDNGSIECGIAKDPENFPKMKVCTLTGKHSQSYFEVLDRDHNLDSTTVLFKPVTGRTHQLRIHAAVMGHPILGCDIYGKGCSDFLSARLMLHASSIEFDHPITNKRVMAESTCPF